MESNLFMGKTIYLFNRSKFIAVKAHYYFITLDSEFLLPLMFHVNHVF